MMTSKRNKLLGLALTGSFSLFGASGVYAAAGDTISNFATLQYSVGTSPQTVIESGSGAGNSVPGAGYATANGLTTDFLEDRVINFTVTRESGDDVVPGSTGQAATAYIVENTGNGTHGFLLAGVHNLGALDPLGSGNSDIYTPTNIQTWIDVNDDGNYVPADDNVAFIASMAPGAANAVRVFVVSDIPLADRAANALINNDVAVVSLVAQAAVDGATGIVADAITADDNSNTSPGGVFTNGAATVPAGTAATNPDTPTTMETVFNDTAATDPVTGATVDATGANDADQNAQQSAYSTYTVQSAALTVAKAATTLWDPVNDAVSPKAIPGAYVTYSISVANAAAAADAALTTLSDILPAELVLDPDYVTSDGSTPTNAAGDSIEVVKGATTIYCTAAADGDGCDYAANTVSVDFTNATFAAIMPLAATETVTVNFNGIVQ